LPLKSLGRSGDRLAGLGPSAGGAGVLDRPGNGLSQNIGGVKGPVGIPKHLARKQDDVGLAGADDLVGLGGAGDHANSAGGNFDFAVDGLRVVDLIAGAEGNLLGWMVAASGDVYEVDVGLLHEFGEGDGLREVPVGAEGLWGPVGGGDADEEGKVLGPCGADGADDFEWEADAVVEAAAVLVCAVVGEGREELVEQVAVGSVYFDEVEFGGKGAMGGGNEVGDDFLHAGAIEDGGDGVGLVEAHRGRSDWLPATFNGWDCAGRLPRHGHAGFAAGVGELGASVGAVLVEEGGDALELGDVLVLPDAEVAGSDAGFRADGVGLGDDEAGSTDGAAAEVDEVPVVGEAVD